MSGLGNPVDIPYTPALFCHNQDPNSPFSSRSQLILKPDPARLMHHLWGLIVQASNRRDEIMLRSGLSLAGPVYLLLHPDSCSASGSASDLILI